MAKIIQISACFDNEGNAGNEYLDDEGRVWYQSGKWEGTNLATRTYVNEWHQLELPTELLAPPTTKEEKG